MRITYFYQYFSTSQGAWGTRVYEFTKEWVKQGHDVTVVSSIYAKSDLKGNGLVSDQNIEGVHVKVINVLIDNRQSALKRIWTFFQYAAISCWYAVTLKADVVIASSGPITVGLPGLAAKWFRGRKLVFEARDLWPEGAVKMGVIKNRTVIKLAYWFEKVCYRNAAAIVGLSPGIQQDIQSRFPRANVHSVTNAANMELFATPQQYPGTLPARSYALYFGNIGQVNHSQYLVEAAKLLRQEGRSDIYILLIGEGQLKEKLKEEVKQADLRNVLFLDLMPKSLLVGYIQHALASVIPLKPIPVFDTSSPNKLFESMAAGVPVIQTTQGWIKEFLEEHKTGFTADGNQPGQLSRLLMELKDNPALVAETGARGSAVAKKFFDKDYLADKMLGVLKAVHESE